MTAPWKELDAEFTALSRAQSPEAQYYWSCHRPRYRYLAELVPTLGIQGPVLDVGMGFQTPLLEKLLPGSRVDCLGIEEDCRYRPSGDFTFHAVNLNDLAVIRAGRRLNDAGYALIVCMEVIEHLTLPPEAILPYLAAQLAPGGCLLVTTPNAAWLKNRLKLLRGKNPFERLSADPAHLGHIREYTAPELAAAFALTGLRRVKLVCKGLYHFANLKDRAYSVAADAIHPSLARTLVALYQALPAASGHPAPGRPSLEAAVPPKAIAPLPRPKISS